MNRITIVRNQSTVSPHRMGRLRSRMIAMARTFCLVVLALVAAPAAADAAEVDLPVVARLTDRHFAGTNGHAIAFSPDGRLLANARSSIGIWDAATGER